MKAILHAICIGIICTIVSVTIIWCVDSYISNEEAHKQAIEHVKEAREDFQKERDSVFIVIDSVFIVIKEHLVAKHGTTSNTLNK